MLKRSRGFVDGGDEDMAAIEERPYDVATKRTRSAINYSENDIVGESSDDETSKDDPKKQQRKRSKSSREMDYEQEQDEDEDDGLNDEVKVSGRVNKIFLKDFMSHRKFELKFGPNVNFVTGPNGSGKSAVVAALQLCLGTKMGATGRGNAMSGLIRAGSPGPAIVRVTLLNEGPDAHHPELYGPEITIERIISRTSPAAYRICGTDGVVRSREKRELENILKTFSIYCDNPCCVLTQELSKRFISGTETDKYEFFLKATGLELTQLEIDKCVSEYKETDGFLQGGTEKLRSKIERVRLTKQEVEKFKQFDKLEKDIQQCVVKRFWVEYHDSGDMVRQIESQLTARQAQNAEAVEAFKAAEREKEEVTDLDAIQEEIKSITVRQGVAADELAERDRDVKAHIRIVPELASRLKTMSVEQKENEDRLRKVSSEIKSLRTSALNAAKENEKSLIEAIEERRRAVERIAEQNVTASRDFEQKTAARDMINEQRKDHDLRIRNFETVMRGLDEEIDRYSGDRIQDRSALFHAKVPEILRKIRALQPGSFQQAWHGPAGLYVKLREGVSKTYGPAVEKGFKSHLSSFVVSCKEDQNLLKNIIISCQAGAQIKVVMQHTRQRHQGDMLNTISNGLSLMAAVTIDNDAIFNMFVDQVSIDRILLSPDENDVEQNFVTTDSRGRREFRCNIQQAILKDGVVIRYRDGNRGRDANRDPYRSVLAEDMTIVVASLRERRAADTEALRAARVERDRLEHDITKENQDIKRLQLELQSNKDALRREARAKENLENDLEQIQEAGRIDTSVLEEEERELRMAIESYARELATAQSVLDAAEAEKKSRVHEKQRAQKVCDNLVSLIEKLRDNLDKFMNKRSEIQANIDRCRTKVALTERAVVDTVSVLDSKKVSAQEKRKDACERTSRFLGEKASWDGEDISLGDNETDEYLRRRIEVYERKLEEGKRQVGLGRVTRDQAIANLENAQEDYVKLKDELENLAHLVSDLKTDLKARRKKWLSLRELASAKVDKWFDAYLQKKAHSGEVVFDHVEKKLRITTKTDNNDDLSQCDDVKQLSGGERSFTTLCLLLALGHVIDTPFRILDEYDVFMDENVRKITLNSIKDHALLPGQREKQFIIITPNTLKGISTSNEVRIHMMSTPERESATGLQQQTLNVSSHRASS